MEDIFKPQSLTIKQLFGNADALYQIPRYQRPYSWGEDPLEKLWDDLFDAMENDPNYFLGSIITAKPQEASNYLDIVDGQQRLTTLLILLCVYRDLYPNINYKILESDPFAIDANTIKTSIKFNDRFQRLRLKTHSNHETDFTNIVLKEGISIQNKRPLKKDLRNDEDPKHKFINTAVYFTEKLTEIGEETAGQFLNFLFNNVKIIRIDCQSVSFAIKLFQVLNDRGLDLSNSDLIKSHLVGKIHKIYDDEEVKRQKEDQFIDDWKFCSNLALDTEERLNDLFVLYEYYLLGDNPKKSLYDELVTLFENKDPNVVLSDFKSFLTHYKSDVYFNEDPIMYGFWYLPWSMYWRTIVLTALYTGYPEYEKFLKVFKRYYYLNWIAGNTLTKIKQTSFNIIKWLKEKKGVLFIQNELEKLLNENVIQRVINNLNSDIYYEKWCKPLLFLIEYNQQDNPKFLEFRDKNIHVEHVLPRAFLKKEDWNYMYRIKGIENCINTGANLTLLSGRKNIVASNDGFNVKIQAYDGTGNHNRNDTKITSFKITQNIVSNYQAGKFNKQWNVDAINDRWVWFCSEVEFLLEIDLSEIKNAKLEINEISNQ